MAVHGFEVERTYVFRVDGVDDAVKARVCRDMAPSDPDKAYTWEVSHYYRPTQQSPSVSVPSRPHSASADEAERLMRVYVTSFTNLGVTRNESY